MNESFCGLPKKVNSNRLIHNLRHSEGGFGNNVPMRKTPISQVLTRNLEDLMERRGINQQRLAERTGLSTSTVSEIRRGIASPGLDTLERFAQVLGVEVWEMLVDSEETRRLAIERAISRPPMNDEYLPPKVEDLRPRKEAAHKRRKKTGASSGAKP
jgi:transcriptional regulator with XRE-family HTH domain